MNNSADMAYFVEILEGQIRFMHQEATWFTTSALEGRYYSSCLVAEARIVNPDAIREKSKSAQQERLPFLLLFYDRDRIKRYLDIVAYRITEIEDYLGSWRLLMWLRFPDKRFPETGNFDLDNLSNLFSDLRYDN